MQKGKLKRKIYYDCKNSNQYCKDSINNNDTSNDTGLNRLFPTFALDLKAREEHLVSINIWQHRSEIQRDMEYRWLYNTSLTV
jgi:hypothetical protein